MSLSHILSTHRDAEATASGTNCLDEPPFWMRAVLSVLFIAGSQLSATQSVIPFCVQSVEDGDDDEVDGISDPESIEDKLLTAVSDVVVVFTLLAVSITSLVGA